MGRWQPGARERLERAALELFVEQGFANTTVPHITARAGLTTRTFFRHFADKREVLFAGEDEIPGQVARSIADAPATLSPIALVVEGLQAFAANRFEGRREHLRTRRNVVQADEGLRERELRKLAALSDALRQGFLDRGVDELESALAAQVAVAVFNVSIGRWLDADSDEPLSGFVLDALASLRSVTAGLMDLPLSSPTGLWPSAAAPDAAPPTAWRETTTGPVPRPSATPAPRRQTPSGL